LSARSSAALAFDNQTQSLILFGGFGGTGDTWSFSGNSWTRLTPANSPSSRGGAALLLDPLNGSVLLFGGCAASACAGGPFAETWEYSGADWVNLTGELVNAPSARSALMGGADPVGSTLLLVGGLGIAPLNDTFQFDQVQVTTPTLLPTPIDVGLSSTVTTTASSPIGALQYLWLVSPAGCFSANLPTDVCMPPAAGSFPVAVRVTDGAGLSVVSFATTLAVNPRPTATAQAAPTAGTVPLQVTFNAGTAGGTPPFTFAWVFGDGSIGVGSNPEHTYLTAGDFAVHLWANDSFGTTALANLTVQTVGPFTTHLTILPGVVVLGGSVTLYANASGGHGPYTESYTGLPQGCASRNASTLSCVPTVPGLYNVRVTTTDSAHLVQNVTGSLDVVEPIALLLTLSPATLALGQVFTVNATVTGGTGINTLRYTGLPSTCTGNNRSQFTCRSDLVGAFIVNATVMDSSGAKAHDSATLTVTPASATSSGGGLSDLWIGGIIAVVVVAAILGLLLYRRRRRGPPIVPPPHANVPPPADLYVPPPDRPRP
jgi:PKD repeat protein